MAFRRIPRQPPGVVLQRFISACVCSWNFCNNSAVESGAATDRRKVIALPNDSNPCCRCLLHAVHSNADAATAICRPPPTRVAGSGGRILGAMVGGFSAFREASSAQRTHALLAAAAPARGMERRAALRAHRLGARCWPSRRSDHLLSARRRFARAGGQLYLPIRRQRYSRAGEPIPSRAHCSDIFGPMPSASSRRIRTLTAGKQRFWRKYDAIVAKAHSLRRTESMICGGEQLGSPSRCAKPGQRCNSPATAPVYLLRPLRNVAADAGADDWIERIRERRCRPHRKRDGA